MVFRHEKKIRMIFVFAVLALFLTACGSKDNEISGNVVSNEQPVPGNEDVNEMVVTKTFRLQGENFKFIIDGSRENPDLVVNEGDKVRIEFKSGEGFHDFVVDELNARTSKVRDGESTTVEFVADKKGTFEYYCSVGEHRTMGMKGRFIVN